MTETPGPANTRPDKAITASGAVVQGGAPDAPAASHGRALPAMIVGSIGVVYGDMGTSPLYALRESLSHAARPNIVDGRGGDRRRFRCCFTRLFSR